MYAVHADGTAAAGWTGGLLLHTDYAVQASPVIGDVMNTGQPQVIAACTDGNVFVIWKDGTNHTGGPIADLWTCAQNASQQIFATPTICSLDGSLLNLIVGSTDGVYKINLYNATFQPGSARWPWPTFLYNSARTSCNNTTTYSPASVSIIGKVRTSAAVGIPGATVAIEYESGGVPPVVNGNNSRVDPVYTAGDPTNTNEINRGGFVINQLPILSGGARYKLTISKPGYSTRYVYVTPVAGKNIIADVVY
ncbi:MAG: carboxypeptidase-like regulatory domain-containing protein [Armatimonadota bacterium]|nr:carboxypeptidase-like regulatory domain-containing protein [Armatimonadota bacterium]